MNERLHSNSDGKPLVNPVTGLRKNSFTPGLCYRVSVNGGSPNAWSAPVHDFANFTLNIKLIEIGSDSPDVVSVIASGGTTLDLSEP